MSVKSRYLPQVGAKKSLRGRQLPFIDTIYNIYVEQSVYYMPK
jgi:hypothetical protein